MVRRSAALEPRTALAYAAFAFVTAFAVARPAAAEPAYDGQWKQGPLREEFTVRQWLPGCGPEPQSSSTGGGEIVAFRLEGDELVLVGGGRVYRTNQCYDPMPSLVRETHSRDANGKTWRTRCATPPNDPRRAVLNTLMVFTTDQRLDLVETGRYEVALSTGTCMADVKRTRSWEGVAASAPAPTTTALPAEKPAATAAPSSACAAPGAPARLEVRPSTKLLRTGESFTFRPVVVDEKGCPTGAATTWRLANEGQAKGLSLDANGKVTVAADAPEGRVEIVATAAGKDARVVVEITEPSHYDELLARSGLNASGESESASTVAIGEASIGAGVAQAEDRARERRFLFVAIVASALVVLGAVGFFLLRRSRKAAALAEAASRRHEERVEEALRRRKAQEDEHASKQRAHEESLAAAEAARAARAARKAAEASANAPRKTADPPPKDRVCPRCHEAFASPMSFCPHDGIALVPNTGATATAKRGKICPTCGDRFDGAAEFCGKDGAQLVHIN